MTVFRFIISVLLSSRFRDCSFDFRSVLLSRADSGKAMSRDPYVKILTSGPGYGGRSRRPRVSKPDLKNRVRSTYAKPNKDACWYYSNMF